MPLLLADALLRGMAMALLALLAAMLWRDLRRVTAARAGIALCLGLCVQLVGSLPWVEATLPRLWQAPWVAVSVANAALFWIFVQALFDDDFAFHRRHAVAWIATAVLSGTSCAIGPDGNPALLSVLHGVLRAVPLVFAVLVCLAALQRWRNDLVEPRRRLRAFIVVAGVIYTVGQGVARIGSVDGRLTGAAAMFDVLTVVLMTAMPAWRLLQMGRSELFPQPGPAPTRETIPVPLALAAQPVVRDPSATHDTADQGIADALARLMREDRPYRREDISLATLAARLSVPEYRLRRVINQRLGHRNFNAYVNGFRLADAQSALADSTQRDLPVLSIALGSGFQSIGPFNRAFKAATGLTPTEFRREKLADS